MERRNLERRIVGSLIVLLIVEVTLLCLHLGWGGFLAKSSTHDAVLAGQVIKSENELRRRSTDSLVWEKSSADEPLYYYDSVLTLAQSTASLKLFKETEVRLSENTLVTIEPQDDKGYGEIRLKFEKGSFKARNPFANAKVESASWSMEIKTGSEVDLRETGDGTYELGVSKGEVNFKSAAGESRVADHEILKIKDIQSEKMKVVDGLAWTNSPPARIYTHGEDVAVHLQWQSPTAKEIVIQTLGQAEQVIPVGESARTHELKLPLGRHQLFLRAPGATSAALEIEVWKAPLLHLLAPLPRNRVKTQTPVEFVWMSLKGVTGYSFIFKGRRWNFTEPRPENSYSKTFNDEDDAQWSVEGRDEQGFVIPPLYSYPLYIREAPLSAPKLHAPMLRAPAKVGKPGARYFWLDLLLPKAQADEIKYQAVFGWEPVEGADRYVIEISETADFRTPVVTKTVEKNDFTWRNVELKTYYWRVAAETKRGRMGIFSEPSEINLKEKGNAGVEVMPLQGSEPPPELPPKKEKPLTVHFGPVAAPVPPPPPAVAEPAAAPPPIRKFSIKPHKSFEWRPVYSMIDTTNADGVRASVQGPSSLSFAASAFREYAPERLVRVEFEYTHHKFRPDPPEKFPSQSDLAWDDISGLAAGHMNSTHLGYGIYVQRTAITARDSAETVTTRPTINLGPCVEGLWQFEHSEVISDFMFVVGSQYGMVHRLSLRLPVGKMYFGIGTEGSALYQKMSSSYLLSGQGSLGFDF